MRIIPLALAPNSKRKSEKHAIRVDSLDSFGLERENRVQAVVLRQKPPGGGGWNECQGEEGKSAATVKKHEGTSMRKAIASKAQKCAPHFSHFGGRAKRKWGGGEGHLALVSGRKGGSGGD